MTSTTAYEPRSDVLWPLGGMYVEGQWTSGPWTLDVTDPETGKVVDVVSEAGAADADRAVAYLAREYPRAGWPLWARREALATAARLVVDKAPELAAVISEESSKTIREARSEVKRAAETLPTTVSAAPAGSAGTPVNLSGSSRRSRRTTIR